MRYPHLRAGLIALCALVSLSAQTPPSPAAWFPLLQDTAAGVDLRVQIQPATGGYQVAFQNRGTHALAFGFYLDGAQTRGDLPGNGRIQLEANDSTSWILVRTSPATVTRVVPAYVRFDEDSGPFWLE